MASASATGERYEDGQGKRTFEHDHGLFENIGIEGKQTQAPRQTRCFVQVLMNQPVRLATRFGTPATKPHIYTILTAALQTMAKAKKAKKKKSAPVQPSGRLGAEQWLAVRLKTGAGPMEPKARRGTRAERERAALELENGAREGKDL